MYYTILLYIYKIKILNIHFKINMQREIMIFTYINFLVFVIVNKSMGKVTLKILHKYRHMETN